jgi:hypothetical protein
VRPPYAYRKGGSLKPKTVRANPELALQISMKQWLTYVLPPEVKWGSTLNGVHLGIKARSDAKASGFQKGALDLFFIISRRTFWVEIKVLPNKLTKEQREFIEALHPDAWAVVYSIEELEAALIRFGAKLKPYVWGAKP